MPPWGLSAARVRSLLAGSIHPWTTSPASAARIPTARSTADATPATSRSAAATASTSSIRLLYCNACKARFSERKGTPLFHCHLPEEKALAVLEHLDEGCGVRQTGRLVGVHRDTVVRLARAAGEHAHDAHDELVAFSPSDPRGPVRREVVVRRQEAEELRPRRPGR